MKKHEISKNEIVDFLKDQASQFNSVWVFVNGGGETSVSPEMSDDFIMDLTDGAYADVLTRLEKGEEPEDFRAAMSTEEYDATECFYLCEHLSGYDEENHDIVLQFWSDDAEADFVVIYKTRTEGNSIDSFDTLDEAVAFINDETFGAEECEDADLENDTHGYHWYEVYDMSKATEDDLGEPVYSSKYYWD